MPVAIDTFDVVVDDQPQSHESLTVQEPLAQPERGATPHEVENILRRAQERLARVLAH